MRIAVIVPCFNEARRLAPERFLALVRNSERIDLLFVDDGSTDGTRRILDDLAGRAQGRVTCVSYVRNRGKAAAVREGFLRAFEAGYGLIGFWDADLAIPIDMIPRFVERFEDPAVQMVIGSRLRSWRAGRRRRGTRLVVSRVLAVLAERILQLGIHDTQCGAKLFRNTVALRRAFAEPFSVTWVFDVEVLARLRVLARQGVLAADALTEGLVEFPVETGSDIADSKIGLFDIARGPFDLCRIRRYLRRNLAGR